MSSEDELEGTAPETSFFTSEKASVTFSVAAEAAEETSSFAPPNKFPKPKESKDKPAGSNEETKPFCSPSKLVIPLELKLLSAAYLPTEPKVAPVTKFNNEPAEELLTPE